MLFRTLTKASFRALVDIIMESNEVVGPKRVGVGKDGKPLHQFLPIGTFDELDLDYETTEYSAKTYFLPFKENLSTYRFEDGDWSQHIRYRVQPRAIIGMHACDINALLKLDKVLGRDRFPSPYYVSRRKNTFIVGVDHDPCEHGFCQSLGEDTVTHGFDLFLTDLGDRYFVAIDSDYGWNVLQRVEVREVAEQDTHDYLATRKRIASGFKTRVHVENLPNLLDIEFESDVWKKWGDKCMSCGSCAMVCPTCYCYGVQERISMDFSTAAKVRQLYSCNLVDFAMVAGGHNFRPTRQSRLKYRYYHQHRGFVEAYDEPKCVGCNRCGRVCLAGINPPDVISDLQLAEETP
ncbi:MAG: 4Fe-4S dicluster domain-containing protein [Polyangiaceae bacterium]|jgi:formate hydrogenlyase subunit 6/NADH:ubiquinone oxidoreductase subunit I|nr:4Fe-4S dicluster domain-containing protein [Polyangiaceae bacterium]